MNHHRDINEFIQKEFSGQNGFKQHEKDQYLGVFAERIQVLVTNQHVENKIYQATIEKIIVNNPGGKIKINADIKMKSRLAFIKIAQKHSIPFTLVDNDSISDSTTQIAVIYHFEQPTFQNVIDVSQLNS